jgi:ATP-binding cassette subfamily C protein CydD
MNDAKTASRAWLREQSRLGRRGSLAVAALGLLGCMLAIGQAWCAGYALQAALIPATRLAGLWLLAGFAALAVLRAGLSIATEKSAFEAGATARRRLRTDALTRVLAAGPALLRQRHSGDLASVVVDRIEAVGGLFARWLPAAMLAIAGPVVVLAASAFADPIAALVLAGCGLLVPLAMALSGIGAALATRRQFAALTHLQARFLDRVRGIATIVMYGRAADEAAALAAAAAELRRRTMRVLRVAFLSSVALDLAMALALIVLALRYGAAALAGQLASPGRALFVLLLVAEFFAPLRAFAAAYQERFHAAASAEALTALPPTPEPAPERPVRTVEARGVSVAFENVTLTWDPARGPALSGLSFRLPAGETLLLIGPSGSGKSTVLEILLGFARPDSGRVTLNGADIATLVPQALARLTAWIGQQPTLFAGSIRDNILFARPEAAPAEVAEAAHLARMDSFAATLPQGLDTIVGEGGYGLSGGQAQRVAIARAFLRNAPLLLLDEPTLHLDPATEAEVLDSLKRLTVGRTVILASHSSAAHGFGGRRLDLRAGRAAA